MLTPEELYENDHARYRPTRDCTENLYYSASALMLPSARHVPTGPLGPCLREDSFPFQQGMQGKNEKANAPRPATDRTHEKGEDNRLYLPRGLKGKE
jgi:hypothetical protein